MFPLREPPEQRRRQVCPWCAEGRMPRIRFNSRHYHEDADNTFVCLAPTEKESD